MIKKIIGIAIIALVLLEIHLLESDLQGGTDFGNIGEFIAGSDLSILTFLVLGLTIGSLACPACTLPVITLAGYVMGAEPTAKKAFWAGLIFQIGRLLVFIPLAGVAAAFNYAIPGELNLLSRGLAGILMILFSMELFDLIDLSRYFSVAVAKKIKVPHVSVDHPLQLAVWGILIGFFCSAEQAGIVGTILLVSPNFIHTFFAVMLFGLGTVITPILLVVFAGGSVELTSKYTEGNITKYAKWLGGLILLYMGILFLWEFLLGLLYLLM